MKLLSIYLKIKNQDSMSAGMGFYGFEFESV